MAAYQPAYVVRSGRGHFVGRGFFGDNPDRFWTSDPADPETRRFESRGAAERFTRSVGDSSWGWTIEQVA